MILTALVATLRPGLASGGEAVRYVLGPGSVIAQVCRDCPVPASRPQALRGSFILTPLPVAEGLQVDALTDVDWHSQSYEVAGTGFLQRSRDDELSGVVSAAINGERLKLRATRGQPRVDGRILVALATPHRGRLGYLVILAATPVSSTAPDGDDDGAADAIDNCPQRANAEQSDDDRDGIGDACDACPRSAAGAPVGSRGCTVSQMCPCSGPGDGGPWEEGEYKRCVATALRTLRREDAISRKETLRLLRRALRSGCGQTVIALL